MLTMEVYKLKDKKEYFDRVQKFLDFVDNVKDDELKKNILKSYFSSIGALCKIAGLNYDELCDSGKNYRD